MKLKMFLPTIALFAAAAEFPDGGGGATPGDSDQATDPVEAETTVPDAPADETAPGDAVEAAADTVQGDAPVEAVEAPVEQPTPAEAFDAEFPSFGPWFDRVQKWAQFNSRPVPEPTATWEADYAAKVRPCEAAEKNCMPQP